MTKKERKLPNGYDVGPLETLLQERSKLTTDIEELTQHMANLEDQIRRAVESGQFDDEEGVKQVNVKRTQIEMCTFRIEKWAKRIEDIEKALEQNAEDIATVIQALAKDEIGAITTAAEAAILPFVINRPAANSLARGVDKIRAVSNEVFRAEAGAALDRVHKAMSALKRWQETGSLIVWPPKKERVHVIAESASEPPPYLSMPHSERISVVE